MEKDTEERDDSKIMSILPNDLEDEPRLILENGEINWNCPCLGGMAAGHCGIPVRHALDTFLWY